MLTLCGFSASNYYNKVKLALMEKQIPFEEKLVWLGNTNPDQSPLGKVPYLLTKHGAISESDAIIEYVDTLSPTTPLLPSDPFAAAKVRELCVYLNLHLELVARNLYPQAFFGGKVSDAARDKTLEQLKRILPPSPGSPASTCRSSLASSSAWPTAAPSCICR